MVLPLKSNLFGKTFATCYIFLTFYKTKYEFPRDFFSATKVKNNRKWIVLPYFLTVKKKKINNLGSHILRRRALLFSYICVTVLRAG